MIYEQLFHQAEDRRVRTGLIGAGAFGVSLLTQTQLISRLEIPVVCDQDVEAAQRAWQTAGIPKERIVVCDSRRKALEAIERGKCVIAEDCVVLLDLPLDVIVECTGNPEAGARHAEQAIKGGKHVAMVNKETDSVVGPILHQLAKKAGVVYTPVDGDQHGLLIGLVSWARSLGLEVVCGGKAHARDFVYDSHSRVVTDGIVEVSLSETEMEVLREIPLRDVGPLMEGRRKALKDLGHIQVADLCESVIAANATGLMADVPSLHGPIVRITEIPQVLCPTEAGGILRKRGAIDVVICLRRLDEAGMAGGVFIVFAGQNSYTWGFLKAKGIVASPIGPYGLIYRPYHLLGAETPISILCAGLLNVSTGGLTVRPRVDLAARATRDLKAGSIVDLVDEHSDACVEPLIIPTTEVSEASLLPLYLAVGKRLSVDVFAGTMLTSQMVEAPAASRLWELRREQDRVFREAP